MDRCLGLLFTQVRLLGIDAILPSSNGLALAVGLIKEGLMFPRATSHTADMLPLLVVGIHRVSAETLVETVLLDWSLASFDIDLPLTLLLLQSSFRSQFDRPTSLHWVANDIAI